VRWTESVTQTLQWGNYQRDEKNILRDIAYNSSLLMPDNPNAPIPAYYQFFHPSIQEYFAASYLVSRWKEVETESGAGEASPFRDGCRA